MRDALTVGGSESFENLASVRDGLVERHRALQRLALDVFHHQVIGTDIVNLADVRMVQSSYGAGFLLEARGELLFRDFDRDGAIEAAVASFPNVAHSARA